MFQGAAAAVHPQDPVEVQHLRDNLAGREVAEEAHLPGGAERTTHGATRLAADAGGGAARETHQHGFDVATVREGKQVFAGEAVGAAARLSRRRQGG